MFLGRGGSPLVGAGRDGLVQVEFSGGRAELEAAEAGFTNTCGFEQLLTWHRDLLVTAAGTKHVTTVPAGNERLLGRAHHCTGHKGLIRH